MTPAHRPRVASRSGTRGASPERARPLDAYANCFVRRHRPTQGIETDTPARAPSSALALRELRPNDEEQR